MKTKCLTLIFLISILYSKGQIIKNIGIKGGISFATANDNYYIGSRIERKGYKDGVYSAFTSEILKAKYLSLSIDLGFIRKGMRNKSPDSFLKSTGGQGATGIWEVRRNCISFSPMLKGFYNFKQLTNYIMIGPRVDINVSSNLSRTRTRIPIFILGLTYGAGAEYKIGKLGVILEFSGNPDITSFLIKNSSDLKIRGNAFILNSGLRYYFH